MQKHFFVIISGLAGILVLSGCNAVSNKGNITPRPTQPADTAEPTRPPGQAVKSFRNSEVSLDFYFIDGKYTYYGKVSVPDPCYKVTVDALVAESYPEQVTLNILPESTLKENEYCATVMVSKVFGGTLAVSREAGITVKLSGEAVPEVQTP